MTDAPAGHLDLDALADVLAGERRDDAHLRSCGACADRLAELAAAEVAVVASLATLPPPAVPEGLADRLTAVLREEGERAAAEHRDSARAGVVPLRRRAPTWLPAVAASLVLVLAGLVGFSFLQGPSPGPESATSAAGGGTSERSLDGRAESDQADSGSAGATLADGGPVRSATGTDWAEQDARAAAVPQVLAGTVSALEAAPATSGPGPDPLDRLRDPTALEACLSALPSTATPGTQTLAVDYARHGGTPALAVLQRDGDPGGLLVTVVGPGCGPADAEQLLQTRVPGP